MDENTLFCPKMFNLDGANPCAYCLVFNEASCFSLPSIYTRICLLLLLVFRFNIYLYILHMWTFSTSIQFPLRLYFYKPMHASSMCRVISTLDQRGYTKYITARVISKSHLLPPKLIPFQTFKPIRHRVSCVSMATYPFVGRPLAIVYS